MKKTYFAISGIVVAMIACQTIAAPITQSPAADIPAINTPASVTPAINTPSSSNDCTINVSSYDLPHSSTKVGGKELYDLAEKGPANTYLEVEAIVTEAEHLVSSADGVDGTLVFAHIDDLEGSNIHQYYLLIYLPDEGKGVSQIAADSRITASGLYVGYVYPPANLFKAFPNENEDTKFPSTKAEFATYGCP